MKKIIYLLFLIITLSACSTKENEVNTINWIESHNKPIIVKFTNANLGVSRNYTLIDSDSKIYKTGLINMILPDTIK